jgi:hypothetical protein
MSSQEFMQEFSYKNQFGSIKIIFDDNIIITTFKDAVSVSIVEYFIKTTERIIQTITPRPWGYISFSLEAQAATPEAYKLLIKAAKTFQQHGCVKSAYVLGTPIAIAQTEQLMAAIGITTPLKNFLFDDLEQAKNFISSTLRSHE